MISLLYNPSAERDDKLGGSRRGEELTSDHTTNFTTWNCFKAPNADYLTPMRNFLSRVTERVLICSKIDKSPSKLYRGRISTINIKYLLIFRINYITYATLLHDPYALRIYNAFHHFSPVSNVLLYTKKKKKKKQKLNYC